MPRKPKTDADAGTSTRRRILRGAGATLCGGLLVSAGVSASKSEKRGSIDASVQADATYGFAQDEECVSLSPISGDASIEEFYRYDEGGTRYSAAGPITAIERARTSRLFLYRDPDESLSLVVVHGEHHIEDVPEGGGSASFTFEGLPSDGEWMVRDDYYDGPDLFDEWELDGDEATVHWTWHGVRTDGAAFTGLGEDFSITIEPKFNEDAELYEEYYEGSVEAWEALGGDQTNPEVVSLSMDQSVTIELDNC